MSKIITGYKAFNKDFTCNGYQYEVGQTYEMDGAPIPCSRGFHYCPIAKDVLKHYPPTSRFAVVEDLGLTRTQNNKNCTNKIKIVRELTREEMVELCGFDRDNLGDDNLGHNNTGHLNTGDWNTGDWNTGHRNTGDCNTGQRNIGHRNAGACNIGHRNTGECNTGNWNTGNRNAGDCNTGFCNTSHCNTGDYNTGQHNTGHRNTGNWNTGNRNTGRDNTGNWNTGDWNTGGWNTADSQTGFFNSKTPENIDVFNKKCDRKKWLEAAKPDFIFNVMPNIWVPWDEMTNQEKIDHENAYTQYGYLKSISMKEAWAEAFETVTDRDIELLKALPNYSYDVFSEITGIIDDRLK